MLLFIFVTVCGLFGRKRVCARFFAVCLCICFSWRSSCQEKRVEIPLNSLTRHIFVSVSSQDVDFQRHMSWSSLCSVSSVSVRGDIGGIYGHHCLNFFSSFGLTQPRNRNIHYIHVLCRQVWPASKIVLFNWIQIIYFQFGCCPGIYFHHFQDMISKVW